MSILVKDQETARQRKKLKGQDGQTLEVSLRDQIAADLLSKLKEKQYGQKMVEVWRHGNFKRQVFLQRQQEYLSSWDEFVTSDADGPFEGSSNLHLPIQFTAAKTFHARMFQALLGVDPPFTTKARREDSMGAADLVDDLMAYTMKQWLNGYEGCEEVVDNWLWDWITTGTGILKASWETKWEKFVDVVKTPYKVTEVQTMPDGTPRAIQTQKYREREKEVVIEVCKGPRLDHIRHEDYLKVGNDVDMHRDYLTASDMWMCVDQKIFDESAVQAVIKGGENKRTAGLNNEIKTQRVLGAGQTFIDSEADLDLYEVLEAYASIDLDDDGINSEIVMWVHVQTMEILRATYLRRINKAGERPFSVIHFHKRIIDADAGTETGIGLIEVMHPLAVEIDAMHNIRVDYGLISNMPYFFYRPASNVDAVVAEIAPGKGIPLDNPQTDVYFPPMSNRTAFGYQEEQNLQTHLQRLTGLSDMSMGMLTGDQGATRTATGARALVGEANANLDIHLRRLNRGWAKALKLILHMLQQRIEPGFAFMVTGQDGNDYFSKIQNRADIAGDFDFEISPNTANSNRAITQQTASQVYQLTSNPLDYQLGIITAGNRYEAIKNQLQSFGIKDWSRFITKSAQATYQLTPHDELLRILHGIDVPVTPQMDHEGFIFMWEQTKKSDELLGQFNEQQAVMAENQAKKHKQMLDAMQSQQGQQANVQQQQMNAQGSQASFAPSPVGNVAPGDMGSNGQG